MDENFEREITAIDYSKIPKKFQTDINKIRGLSIGIRNLKFDFDNLSKNNLIYADDNYLVFNPEKELKSIFRFNIVFTFLFFLAFFLPVITSSPEEDIPILLLLVTIIIGMIFILQLYMYFFSPKKELILNRKKGVITFPDVFYKRNNTMLFSAVEWASDTIKHSNNLFYMSALNIRSPKSYYRIFGTTVYHLFGVTIYFDKLKEDLQQKRLYLIYDKLSLITWYMDSNRPLPPGKMFDTFRRQDFKRRKELGFPKPLYRAAFLITEATSEEQFERKKIGGW